MAQNNQSNNEAKKAAVLAAMAQIQKQYGTGSIMRLGERAEKLTTQVIPTGSIAVDLALGVGGLPKGRIIEIFGPEASGKCVTTDTLVFTEYGMVPIGTLGDLGKGGFQQKELKVYSEGGLASTSHFYNSGIQKTIRIKTSYGFELEGTPNHRIRIIDADGNYIFRRLDQFQLNDRVAIQRGQNYFGSGIDLSDFNYQKSKHNHGKDYNYPSVISSDLARLMGYLIGDGDCSGKGLSRNNISITIADDEVATDFTELCKRIFGESPSIVLDKRTKNTRNFRIFNSMARKFLEYAGLAYCGAADKQIPYSIMQAPQKIVASFLAALYEADGCFSGGTIEYCSKSRQLVKQLQLVLLNFGIISKIKERVLKTYPKNIYYYLYIDGYIDQKIFAKEIGFISKRKNGKLLVYIQRERQYQTNRDLVPFINNKIAELMKNYRVFVGPTTREHWDVVYDYLPATPGHSLITYPRLNKILNTFQLATELKIYQELKEVFFRNIFWDKVSSIEKSNALVVDFTVPETSSFFGNGFINHNTTIALHVISEAQKRGGVAAFIDAEHALDPQRAQKIGVNLDDLLISQPDTGEQGLEIAESIIRSGGIDVVVIDSVAALVPRSELEGEMGESSIGVQARLMSQALRKLTGAVANTNTIIIFTNQLRQKIGVMFGNPETTPGGLALKFYASVRLDIRKIENIKEGDLVVGSRHRVKVVKNKVAPPFRIAEFDMSDKGISHEGELLDVGIELGILTKSGAFIRWGEKLLGQGRPASVAYLKENKKEAERLEKEIREAWGKQKEGEEKIVVGPQEEEDGAGTVEEAA